MFQIVFKAYWLSKFFSSLLVPKLHLRGSFPSTWIEGEDKEVSNHYSLLSFVDKGGESEHKKIPVSFKRHISKCYSVYQQVIQFSVSYSVYQQA